MKQEAKSKVIKTIFILVQSSIYHEKRWHVDHLMNSSCGCCILLLYSYSTKTPSLIILCTISINIYLSCRGIFITADCFTAALTSSQSQCSKFQVDVLVSPAAKYYRCLMYIYLEMAS